MKVLHIIAINGYGGAEKLLLHLLPALKEGGVDIECLILNKRGTPEAATSILKYIMEKQIKAYRGEYSSFFDKRNLAFLSDFINEGNYDLVHSHLKYADAWMAILKLKKRITLPVVATMHGYNDNYENKHGLIIKPIIYFTWYYWLTRFIWKRLDGFIMISNIVDRFYRGIKMPTKAKCKTIYHGYQYNEHFEVDVNKVQFQDFSLVVPGRLLKRKGHLYAIEALKKLLPEYPHASLHFYGEGPFEQQLRTIIQSENLEEQVMFHGYSSSIISKLREHHVAVIPSMWEGFGIVFLDAFAAERPIVAFNLPAANEIIEDQYNGLLALPGDSKSLALMIRKIFESPDLGRKLSENALAKLKSEFSISRMSNEYIGFYKTFLR